MSDALTLIDTSFRAGAPTTDAPPTRFHLNLSERCQLRCAHCITDAPQKTADGTAQEMSEAVLDALTPHLAHAHYVAFTHAGEPMLAPLFEAALERVQTARDGQPTVVHLLTNGMGLTASKLERFTSLGVNSLSFSLDGMSAETNDVLRIGGKADTVRERIAMAVETRARDGIDLRIGVAWTLTAANAGEVGDLVRFSADVGLDWVKLEEMFPQNDLAASLCLDPGASARTLGQARMASAGKVTIVDHTRQVTAFKCQLALDKIARRFSEGDDLVNRTDLNACRLPYEQVCVEPSGDVRPVTFHHPVAGNVVDGDLRAIFNGPVFADVRAQQRAARPCGDGPANCPADQGPAHW
jgi:cyclomaltodextrinase